MMIPRQPQLFIFSGNLARGQGMDGRDGGLTDADAAAVLALRPSFMVGGFPYVTSTLKGEWRFVKGTQIIDFADRGAG